MAISCSAQPKFEPIYIGLWAWQQKKWLPDHPELWQTVEDALRDLQARAGTDVEAEPAEPRSTKSANEVRTSGEFRRSVAGAG